MGADTPAAGRETKRAVKHEGRPLYHESCHNSNKNSNTTYNIREKFLGGDANLLRKIFEAKCNQSEQVANFKTVDNRIKAQLGTGYDHFVLKSLEQDSIVGPPEPEPVCMAKAAVADPDVMSEAENIKLKTKFDTYLTWTDKIVMQLQQVSLKYFGQINEDMRGTLKEDDNFEHAYNTKDVIVLQNMLTAITLSISSVDKNSKKKEKNVDLTSA